MEREKMIDYIIESAAWYEGVHIEREELEQFSDENLESEVALYQHLRSEGEG